MLARAYAQRLRNKLAGDLALLAQLEALEEDLDPLGRLQRLKALDQRGT